MRGEERGEERRGEERRGERRGGKMSWDAPNLDSEWLIHTRV